MRGFSLRRPVAFSRSRSSPSPPIAFTLYSSLRSLSPPLHHRRLEWRARQCDFFVAASKSRLEIRFVCDVRELSEGRPGYSGNQSQLICHRFSPGWPHSFEIWPDKTALFCLPLLLIYSGNKIIKNVEKKKGCNIEGTIIPNKDTKKPLKWKRCFLVTTGIDASMPTHDD